MHSTDNCRWLFFINVTIGRLPSNVGPCLHGLAHAHVAYANTERNVHAILACELGLYCVIWQLEIRVDADAAAREQDKNYKHGLSRIDDGDHLLPPPILKLWRSYITGAPLLVL